jgi:hypothetical protein
MAGLRRKIVLIRRLLLLVIAFSSFPGCGADDFGDGVFGHRQQKLCMSGDSGGDFGCGCTLNSQCNQFDDDTRLVVCDVPDGGTVGACTDCVAKAAGMRPVGCACGATADCATGLSCNGRTCQPLRQRGEYCFRDSDCGSDSEGAMRCLGTKSWCGPLDGGNYCDFQSDCLSGKCESGLCTPGVAGGPCATDADCAAPLVCSSIFKECRDKQADGVPCGRSVECQNQCNSFSGLCTDGHSGVICTQTGNADGPDGDCDTGLACTDCGGGAFTCRVLGGPCG